MHIAHDSRTTDYITQIMHTVPWIISNANRGYLASWSRCKFCLPNVYTNVLGSPEGKLNSFVVSYRAHTLNKFSHFSADTHTQNVICFSFLFFWLVGWMVGWPPSEQQLLFVVGPYKCNCELIDESAARKTNVCWKEITRWLRWLVCVVSVVSLKIYNFDVKQSENSCEMNDVKLATSLTLLLHI